MHKYIHHSQPVISENDINSVREILHNGMISKNGLNEKFEFIFNKYLGSLETKLFNSGRSALFICLKILGINENDEIILPTYVCSSVLKIIKLFGAIPVIVDIEENYCISDEIICKYITNRTKAVIYVHTFGIISDIKRVSESLKAKNIFLIEDCAHSIGASYKEKKLGTYGDLAFFSFQATKMITSGEGGALAINNINLINQYRNVIEEFNKLFCISDLNVSLLINQFNKLDIYIEIRKELAKYYIETLKSESNIFVPIQDLQQSVFYRFIIHIENVDFDRLKDYMHGENIAIRKGVDSMLHQNNLGYEIANSLYTRTLSLPIYPSLTQTDVNYICRKLIEGVKVVKF